jgi:hypothetical protein
MGPQGFQGDTGAQGPQGALGVTGAQGPQGTQGFQGPGGLATTVYTAAASVQTAGPISATAYCGSGKYALGGGYSASGLPTIVTMNAPIGGSPATGWQAGETVSGPSSLTTYVICSS